MSILENVMHSLLLLLESTMPNRFVLNFREKRCGGHKCWRFKLYV